MNNLCCDDLGITTPCLCHLFVQACAHLYELRQRVHKPSETRDPIGRCYVLSEDLTKRDDLDGGEWKFCEGRPQGHEQFGFCQQGLAASFTPDRNYILFGAPGTYNWKGTEKFFTTTQGLVTQWFRVTDSESESLLELELYVIWDVTHSGRCD